MTYRPRTASHDENHFIPRDYLRDRCGGYDTAPKEVRGRTMAYTANFRGHRIMAIDTSQYGGVFTDWLIEADNGSVARVEIKTEKSYREKDHGFTAGEMWIYENGGMDFVAVCTDEDFENLLNEMVYDE